MKIILFLIATLGWIASVMIHVIAIKGDDLSVRYPFVMGLHIGIFIVWIPMFFYLRKDEEYNQYQQSQIFRKANPFALFKILFKNTPSYLRVIAVAGLIYASINFMIIFAEQQIGVNAARIFSGHWIAFYGIAMAVLYPFKKSTVL